MRVWALVSCSGLLALAACSTEQASSPTHPQTSLGMMPLRCNPEVV